MAVPPTPMICTEAGNGGRSLFSVLSTSVTFALSISDLDDKSNMRRVTNKRPTLAANLTADTTTLRLHFVMNAGMATDRDADLDAGKNRGAAGHCVICGNEGLTDNDFVCSDCGDPLDVTMFCMRCRRRLKLEETAASVFLASYGYEMEDLSGLVLKLTGCSRCMTDDEKADLSIYRIRFS